MTDTTAQTNSQAAKGRRSVPKPTLDRFSCLREVAKGTHFRGTFKIGSRTRVGKAGTY
jgi:hypothetical protein